MELPGHYGRNFCCLLFSSPQVEAGRLVIKRWMKKMASFVHVQMLVPAIAAFGLADLTGSLKIGIRHIEMRS